MIVRELNKMEKIIAQGKSVNLMDGKEKGGKNVAEVKEEGCKANLDNG